MQFEFKNKIELEDNRVKLSPLDWKHFDSLLSVIIDNPNLHKFSPLKFGTKELLKEYIHNALSQKESGLRYPFVIFDKQKNSFAGSTSYGNISNTDLRMEIGWTWIGKDFQRTGLNRHCKFLLLKYAFEDLQFERVEFKTDSRNLQSRKAIENIGATYEGALRSHILMPDGYRRTSVYYSILRNEWKQLKETIFANQSVK
jgi:N-acetyltransferase